MRLLPPYPEPSKPSGAWTLASYNVQDLFDTSDDPRAEDLRPTENQLQNKLTRLGRVLGVLDADVVGLMEVETRGVLQRLNQEALAEWGYREAILIEGNDPERGIDVALLSRFPVTQVVSHAAETFLGSDGLARRLFSRDCLECHVTLPSGETLVVLVNHFKSKRGGEAETEALRTAQGVRARAIADELLPRFPLLAVVGDLNDTPDSPALQPLLSGPLADILARDIPPANCYTFVHAGRTERIDYLLASPALTARFVSGSALLLHDTWAKRASDHSPARAAFGLTDTALPVYPQNLTAAHDETYPPCLSHHRPLRINAARFFHHDLNPWQGQTVIVTGRVVRAETTRGTGVVRLFLGHGDPRRAFQATILPESRAAFENVGIQDIGGYYDGKMAQGVGTLHFYHGQPEIIVAAPRQLRII